MYKLSRRLFSVSRKQTPTQYGSFEQSFQIPPRYFLVKYKLADNFSDLKGNL